MTDLTGGVDDHADPAGISTHSRGACCTVGESHGAIPVAQQREGEGELSVEGRIVIGRVEAHTQNRSVLGGIFTLEVAEPATLGRSTRGVGLRIEPQHQIAPPVVGQRVAGSGVIED